MKNLIILILLCVSSGTFAQESLGLESLKDNDLKSPNVDFEYAFHGDNELAIASTTADLNFSSDVYTSSTFMDLNTGEVDKGHRVFIKKSLLEDSNSVLREGMVTFSKDRKTVFFSVNRKLKNRKIISGDVIQTKKAVHLQLFKARVNDNGEWVDLEMLPFNSNRHSNGQPYLNKDDSKLYFVSDGPESLGRTDIFVVDLNNDGTYGNPVNLGPEINSSEREILPFINKENVLYFLSDTQNKKDDLDVFASKLFDNSVSTPLKLKESVNIEKSDFTYVIVENVDLNTFFSKEQAGKGVEEIYASLDATGINIDCQQEISGFVKNEDTQELLSNVKFTLYDENEAVVSSFLSNESDATFSFKQSCNTSYTLKGYLDGYLIGELAIQTVNDLNAAPIEIVMNMNIDSGKEKDAILVKQEAENKDLTADVLLTDEEVKSSAAYNFKGNDQIYTVQIGAFKETAETDKYIKLSSMYHHVYEDGLNRYYSGIFESRMEAMNYLELLKKNGFNDAFVVSLQGEKRF